MCAEFINPDLLHSELSALTGFDRLVYTYARMLQVTGASTLKSYSKGVAPSRTEDILLAYLAKNNSRNFETGRSTQKTAKDLNLAKSTVSKTYSNLVKQNLVIMEQKGTQVRYYLPKLISSQPQSQPPKP